MALAWAQAQTQGQQEHSTSALSALLATGGGEAAATECGRSPGADRAEVAEGGAAGRAGGAPGALPPGYVVVFTQVLPDGLGDLIFGENAVLELLDVANVAWVRFYTSEDSVATGERLVCETAARTCFGLACSDRDGLGAGPRDLEALWAGARERFLAPWIFGLSAHEEALLRLARGAGRPFWALTEYGRGMGNIHTYTAGLGSMVPTGWSFDGDPRAGGVFRSVRRAPRTGTDWRGHFAERCGLPAGAPVRLWWFYSRRDDEKRHSFRELGPAPAAGAGAPRAPRAPRALAKVVPALPDGRPALRHEKTSGEKLAEQLFQAASDPGFRPSTDVASAEAAAGSAAELSQFLWGILFDEAFLAGAAGGAADVVVAPNVLTRMRAEAGGDCAVAEIAQLDLALQSGEVRAAALPPGRRLLLCSARIPRGEMRTFLEQCEERVFTTGDQSLTEAMLLGRLPCVRPDAKVQQWQAALRARATGAMDTVPDLGEVLRRLVRSEERREAARQRSRARSDALERQIVAQLGCGVESWTPTQHVLARAGMLG